MLIYEFAGCRLNYLCSASLGIAGMLKIIGLIAKIILDSVSIHC
jgi:hypothetical protein